MRTMVSLSALLLTERNIWLMRKLDVASGYHLNKDHVNINEHLFEKAKKNFVHNDVEIVDRCRISGIVMGFVNAEANF